MGSNDNITNSTFDNLSKKLKKDSKAEVKNLLEADKTSENPDVEEMFEKAANSWGQPLEEAKANTLKLLKTQK